MRDKAVENLAGSLVWIHGCIADTVMQLTQDELSLQATATAPPIGWHVWHIVRWADWLQASFPDSQQIWEQQQIASAAQLDVEKLGPMQAGLCMDIDYAAQIPRLLGRERLINYMSAVFTANETILNALTLDDLFKPRESFAKWDVVEGTAVYKKGDAVVLYDDMTYHLSHASRHLGMIEAPCRCNASA